MIQPIDETTIRTLIRWHQDCLTTFPHLMDPATTELVTQTIMALEDLLSLRLQIRDAAAQVKQAEENL